VHLKLIAMLLILPLLTLAVVTIHDASANVGDSKSCPNKGKETKNHTYSKSYLKTSTLKMSKKSF
jgi:hypothetical protein